MKVIKKSYSDNDKNLIKELSLKANISPITAEILYGRGYDSVQKINEFLNPQEWNKLSPFTLSGMKEAVDRIIVARDNQEVVVVYGDYDADGVCATTVLYKALKKFGVDAYAVIPERDNGYGLTTPVIDEVVESLLPDLIITVDCGISAKDEVEYIKDLGIDVIITDHHELPSELPDTTIVSTKTKNQEYPFEYLSGAGVAYKVAYALIGSDADDYLDFVAISTIADSMPLIGENRNIVYRGVENIKSGRCSRAITDLLIASNAKEITSTSLAFTVAPRINAAGRMGNARSALELFLTEDEDERKDLVNLLVKYNVDRQVECENLLKSVKELLKNQKISTSIILYNSNWNGGLLGIVAARLTEEYNVPTILFAGSDGVYHGSARSTQDINVYDAISKASDILEDYGGHAQAAGVTIKEENIPLFIERFNNYLSDSYNFNLLEKTIEIDYEIDGDYSLALAREINYLEPFGVGNKKPLFLVKTRNLSSAPLKENSPHITIKGTRLDLICFNGLKYLDGLNSDIEKSVIFESSISYYNQKEYAKGIVKTIDFNIDGGVDFTYRSFKNALKNLYFKCKSEIIKADKQEIQKLIDSKSPNDRGTLFVVTNPENYSLFIGLKKFQNYPLSFSKCGGKNAVVIGCDLQSLELFEYQTIVYVDAPIYPYSESAEQKVIISSDLAFDVSNIKKDRNVMADAFKFITASENNCMSSIEIAKAYGDYKQLLFALEVFKELEFIEEREVIFVNRGVKKDLTLSKIYNFLGEKF